jgi:cytochrome c5
MKYIILIIIGGLFFFNCTKDQSIIPKISIATVANNDSLANLDFTKYLGRILDDGSCTGCHDGGAFGGPGPGDFRTYSKFKTTVLKSGNPVRIEGLGRMSTCGGNFGCLNQLQKDSVSNWLQKYFSL